MNVLRLFSKINPEWLLRLGFGLMFLYSGADIVRHPHNWEWAVKTLPGFIQISIMNTVGFEGFLLWHGIGELVLAFAFLAWFLPNIVARLAALFALLEMASIVALVGVDLITFRDIGLLGGIAALSVILFQQAD